MRGYSCIGLVNPKSSANVGSALRAAGNFGASMVAIEGGRYRGSKTDTMKQDRHMPVFEVYDLESALPSNCVGVAVDLIDGATNLINYTHPERAMYVFGPEDGTLGDDITSWCRDVIYIPTNRCMNLAGTIHVVLYDRMAKRWK